MNTVLRYANNTIAIILRVCLIVPILLVWWPLQWVARKLEQLIDFLNGFFPQFKESAKAIARREERSKNFILNELRERRENFLKREAERANAPKADDGPDLLEGFIDPMKENHD